MSQNTSSSSIVANICDVGKQQLFYTRFNQFCLAPAVIIVVIFMFLKRRVKFKTDCLDGRPGIQIPVDFLGEEQNRFSYVAAYGAMAIDVIAMFLNARGVFTVAGHPFINVFQKIVTVICIGTLFLPMFMCLSTDAKLLGSVVGFFYTFSRFVGLIARTVFCPIIPLTTFPPWPIFYVLPSQLFHVVLLVRFALVFVKEVRSKCIKKKFVCRDLLGDESDFATGTHHVNHVKTLLRGAYVPRNYNRKWYVKGRNFVYKPQPHFKYSVTILSCVVVAGVIVYEFLVIFGGDLVGYLYFLREQLVKNYMGHKGFDLILKFVDISIVSLIVSMILGALFMYFQMYRMLVSHRDNVIKLIKGDRSFLPDRLNTPHVMVGKSLRFAGYQVAYFLLGFLTMTMVLLLISLIISALVLLIQMNSGFRAWARNFGFTFLPTVLMTIFILVLQRVLTYYVFKDRSTSSQVVDIHNRRLFLLVSFFFFFFNIVVGSFSFALRIIKVSVLGIIFAGRIDRPVIMKGFTNLDTAYRAYIGFLHLQVAHKHPVVRVFCHLLWSGMRRKQLQRLQLATLDFNGEHANTAVNGGQELNAANPSRPRVSASALNKWFIAITVIRNPTLACKRRGYLRHVSMGISSGRSLDTRDGTFAQCMENQAIPEGGAVIEKQTSKSMEQFTQTQFDDTTPLLINV